MGNDIIWHDSIGDVIVVVIVFCSSGYISVALRCIFNQSDHLPVFPHLFSPNYFFFLKSAQSTQRERQSPKSPRVKSGLRGRPYEQFLKHPECNKNREKCTEAKIFGMTVCKY